MRALPTLSVFLRVPALHNILVRSERHSIRHKASGVPHSDLDGSTHRGGLEIRSCGGNLPTCLSA